MSLGWKRRPVLCSVSSSWKRQSKQFPKVSKKFWVGTYVSPNENLYVLKNKTIVKTKLTFTDYLTYWFKQISWSWAEHVFPFSLCGGNDGLFLWRMNAQKPYYAKMKKTIRLKDQAQLSMLKPSVPMYQITAAIQKGRQMEWKTTKPLL